MPTLPSTSFDRIVISRVCLGENLEPFNIELSSAAAYNPAQTVPRAPPTLPYAVQGDCSNDLLGPTLSFDYNYKLAATKSMRFGGFSYS
jgi:hypothetical protein